MEQTTLAHIYKEVRDKMPEEEQRIINTELLLLVHLSSLQQNIALNIEEQFRKYSQYKMTIKHNHEKIKSLIRGTNNNEFWERLSQEQIDSIADDADDLEDIIFKWAGLKPRDKQTTPLERAKKEYTTLEARLLKLSKFLTSDKALEIPEQERILMSYQAKAMQEYSSILYQMIKLMEERGEK